MTTLISAIIVNWNDRDRTADCLRSLSAQDHPAVDIIVCDNGSTDGSVPFLRERFPQVRIIENRRNLGFGAAVNRGFEAARGEHLIFLNNDLVLAPDCLRRLSARLSADATLGGAVPKILFEEPRDRINSFGVEIHYTGMAGPHLIGVADSPRLAAYETACGGIFMMPRAVVEATGGFDPALFLYHEDHDLSWRIRLLGRRLLACPEAVCYHHYQFSKGVRKYYWSEKNRLAVLLKNYRWRTLALLLPALLALEAAQWVHALGNGWFGLKLKSYLELVRDWPGLMERRARVQATRRVSDAEITALHESTLRLSGVRSPWLEKGLNPLLAWYWEKIRRWI